MSNFQWYADKYNCSLVDAINDRDEPMTAEAISKAWKEDTGRDITEQELFECRPDDKRDVEKERRYNDDW